MNREWNAGDTVEQFGVDLLSTHVDNNDFFISFFILLFI